MEWQLGYKNKTKVPLSDIQIEEINAFQELNALREITHEFDERFPYWVPPSEMITAPDPNHFSREIVIGNRQAKGCPYCGNTSGMKDSRGMCVSCGGDLGVKSEYPKPIVDWKI